MTNSTAAPTDTQKSEPKYESLTFNHLLRSYSLTNLMADTAYKICLTLKETDPRNGYVQLSCTNVHTKPALATTAQPLPQSRSNMGLAIGLSVAFLLFFFTYFAAVTIKKYRLQREYEVPAQKLTAPTNVIHGNQNLAPIPLENIYSPLIKHMRH